MSNVLVIILLLTNQCTIYEVDEKCTIDEYSNEGSYELHRCYR